MEKVSVVGVYLEQNGKILMVQEKGQAWGLWCVPLGHLDKGESLEDSAKREVMEETGYSIEINKNLGLKIVSDTDYKGGEKDKGKSIEVNFLKGKILGGNLTYDRKDLLDARWVDKNTVLELPLRGYWLKEILTSS